MGRLRTSNWGMFAALFALFLQFAVTTAASAQPRSSDSLLSDLALTCTQNGLADRTGDTPDAPGNACDHCVLCHVARLDVTLAPVTPSVLLVYRAVDIFPLPLTVAVTSTARERPTGRAPPHLPV